MAGQIAAEWQGEPIWLLSTEVILSYLFSPRFLNQ